MARLFLAVFPPEDVISQLGEMERAAVEGLRWTNSEQWHITLRFMGEAEPEDVEDILRWFRGTACTVRLGPTSKRLGPGVLVLPAAGLEELAAEVRDRTESIGQPPDRRRFAGHLTLARARKQVPATVVGQPFAAEFRASELWLVSSQLASDGARYTHLANWPLAS